MLIIPWICVAIAVVVTLGSVVLSGARGKAALARADARYGMLIADIRAHLRYRAFDRALAEFRRNARVCAVETLDDTVGIPRD